MRFGRPSSFLGIAVGDRAISIAEVSVNGDRRTLRRAATFALPPELTIESPDALGQAIASFLRQKRFEAKHVVVGLPARWLIAVEREVPPADEQAARAMLRLQAERLAVAESGEVIFDVAGASDANKPTRVLLVGMLRQRLERIQRVIEAAGMTLDAVTSSALALAAGVKDSKNGGLLMLGRNGGEMVWRDAGGPRMLRHFAFAMNGHGAPPIAPLGAELRRAVTMAQSNGAADRGLTLLDGVGLEDEHIADLSQRLGIRVESKDALAALSLNSEGGLAVETGESKIAAFAPAMSLALAGARTESLPLDFLHSRLAPAPVQRISRRGAWAIALAATAVIVLLVTWLSLTQKQNELDGLRKQLTTLAGESETARATIDRLRYGRGFFVNRTPMLECLRELTNSFRDDERIWASSFTMRENGAGTLTGKAADQKTVLALLGRLQKSDRFRDAKLLDSRESDSRSRDVTYSISFTFNPAE